MGIIGGVARVRVVKIADVKGIVPATGNRCEVRLEDGAVPTEWPYVYGTVSCSYAKERAEGGNLWKYTVSGEISPVSAERMAEIDRWKDGGFVALAELKSGDTLVLGSKALGCTLEEEGEVSAGIGTNAISVNMVWKAPHRAMCLEAAL